MKEEKFDLVSEESLNEIKGGYASVISCEHSDVSCGDGGGYICCVHWGKQSER